MSLTGQTAHNMSNIDSSPAWQWAKSQTVQGKLNDDYKSLLAVCDNLNDIGRNFLIGWGAAELKAMHSPEDLLSSLAAFVRIQPEIDTLRLQLQKVTDRHAILSRMQ